MSAINNLLRRSHKGTILQTNVPKMWNLTCAILIRIPVWLQILFVVSLLYEADISNFFKPRTQMHDPQLCNMNQTRRYGVLPKSRRTFCLRVNAELHHFYSFDLHKHLKLCGELLRGSRAQNNGFPTWRLAKRDTNRVAQYCREDSVFISKMEGNLEDRK